MIQRAPPLAASISLKQADVTRRWYEETADAYAATTWRLTMQPWLDAFLARLPSTGRVVDLGCGAGRDLAALEARGVRAFGVELSPALARVAVDRSGAPVVVANVLRTPFADGAFAGVWASASLLHLTPPEVDAALDEARRVLVRHGVLFTSVKAGEGVGRSGDARWFQLHERGAWIARLTRAGFAVRSEPDPVEADRGWITALAVAR